jgi:RHS repeat-associated protein
LISCLVVSAVASTALPQIAYAAPPSGKSGDDKGVFDTVKSWFSDDDEDQAKPPTGGKLEIPSREKLPKGKKAGKAKRVKELTSRRTEHARFWQLSNGQIQAELSQVPTAYRVGSGKKKSWKSIDTGVEATKAKGFDFANTSNSGRSWFGSDPDRLLKFQAGADGPAVTLGLKDAAKSVDPTAKGSTVVYKDAAAGGADLEYRVGPGHVKENIVLAKAPDGPVSYTFTLDTDGLTPKARKDGAIELFGEAPNTPVMTIPAAYMSDTRKDKNSPYGVSYSPKVKQKLVKDGKNWRIVVTPDAKWLASSKRQYPVSIDPTITITPTPTQSQDTMVLSDQPTANFNNTWKMSVGKTDTGIARSLIQFPLDEIPAGTQLDSARLSMYYDQTHTTNANDVTMEVHRATGPWTESGANWSNTSTLSGELSGTTVQIDDGDTGTAAVGEWPRATTTGGAATNDDFAYNKNSLTGETYTWQPQVKETASYRVEAHFPPATDGATAAPYTINHRDGTGTGTVNQSGTAAAWKTVNSTQFYFSKGNTGKIVLGDTNSSTTRNIADSIRLVNPAQIVKNTGEYNQWHDFAVTDTVQKWVSGTSANYGFVIQAKDDTLAGTLTGGPRYESGDGDYGGETSSYPRLTVTYGKVGSTLNSPTVVHDTGPELSWSKYTNSTGDTNQDIVEYQLHRSTQQVFTPNAATLVAPIDKAATAYTDTTATPTPDSSTDEIGRSYYYQIAVKTKDGSLIGSPTRIVGVPKAGRTMKLIQGTAGGVTDTTLSSQQPTTNEDTILSYTPQNWLSVGNNSGTYGNTRAVMKFPTSSIPATATVLNSKLYMWGAETTTDTNGAIYELHGLTKDFAETAATWNNATATTPWTAPGGDFGSTVSDTVAQVSEVGRHWWDATSMTQGWVKTPSSNKGAMVKLANEATGPKERTLFLASEGADQQLGPLLRVIYVDATSENTYYAPQTPQRMTPNSTYTVDVTVTNTTGSTWAAGERQLSYTWKLPDGTDATNGGNQLKTAIPTLAPAESATVHAQVKTPINSDAGNKRTDYVLGWDVQKVSDGSWLSAGTGGIPSLTQSVAVEDPTSNALGLEKFYSYTGKNTGAGSSVVNNLASGNSVWSYNAFSNPGRGLNTFFRLAYNSLDTSDTKSGAGWSMQAAGPIRMGAPLDFRPNPNPTEIRLPDGDGTTHVFSKQGDGTWKAPAGVHFKVTMKSGLSCTPDKDPVPDAWTLTRPDGTRFLFGCDGYMTSAIDKNGNTQTYTYEERKSAGKPTKFLKYVTDPAGRQTLTVDYYQKSDASYEYVNDSGVVTTGSGLTDPDIYDHVKSVTDISGRKLSFYYTDKGLLGQVTDGVGSSQPKVFKFTYDATQGNKNVKLVKVADPRGNATNLTYFAPQTGDDPKYHWWTKNISDRLSNGTGFTYAANTTNNKFTDTKVTDAENHVTTQVLDDFGRSVKITNAKSESTDTAWDADNNVTLVKEANGAQTTYTYDQKTGYPLTMKDAEANKNGTAATVYTYQTRLDGYSADLYTKTSPEGRKWQFGYDAFGNLKTVTDPMGVASPTADDYTTKYDYDAYGEQTKSTDANGNATQSSDFAPVGLAQTVTDPYAKATKFVYDERGQVTSTTDALNKTSTQTYDTFGRALESKVPKDQAAGVYITTPAPVYDANNNIAESTSPSNAVSKATYDPMDQVTSATAPANNLTAERKTAYTYDKVGNLRTTTEPKGVATTADATDYVTTNNYDAIYQLASVVNAKNDKVSYEYDNVGNAVTVIDPKKNATADTTDYTSKTEYDLDHRPVKQIDAAGKYTTTGYDKDSLAVATTDQERNKSEVIYDARAMVAEQKVPYDGTTVRTTRYHYDQVGNTTKVETPRGTATTGTDEDFASRTEYDKLNRPVKQFQPYDPADSEHNKSDVYTETVYDEVGRVQKTSLPPAGDPERIDTDYTYYDNGWIKTSTNQWNVKTAYDYNNDGQQEKRALTGEDGTSTRTMGWSHYPDGSLKARTDAAGDPSADRSYAYDYDLNGNMLKVGETVGSTTSEPYTMTYTGLNQVDKVTEALTGQEPMTTSYTYDANGQLDTVDHPEQHSKYEYDLRNLLKKVTAGQTPTDPQPDITQFTYTDRGQRATLTKGNSNTVDYTYYANSAPKTSTEKTSQGALVSSHSYEYDANGNKSKDTAALLSADSDGVRNSVTSYTYDPVDRIRELDKTGNKPRTEQYWHDDNSNVVKQLFLQKSELTEFYYRKNRLSSSSNLVDSSSIYDYDTFGRLKTVTEDGGAAVETNTFDGFDRLTDTVRKAGDKTNTTHYRYDALDRTVEKRVNDAYTDEYDYLGLSSEVFSDKLDGTLVETYQFGLGGERLSQLNHLNGSSGYYGYNSHGDVETFTNAYDGKPSSTYGYTAYGQDAKDEWTGMDAIAEPGSDGENPYRFNGKRWNAQSETYDMGFREYSPEHNRFISPDSYAGAEADMSLGAGPATSNRYGFVGGNPVNSIERDGHEACDVGCQARSQYRMDGDPVIPDAGKLEFNVESHDGSTGLEGWVDPWSVFKELSGLADIQGCSNDPSAWQCTMAAASVFPVGGKVLKGAKFLDEAVDAGRSVGHLAGSAAEFRHEAEHAYDAVVDLHHLRGTATNEAFDDPVGWGTSAIIGVRNMETGRISIRTGINGAGEAPDSWPKWARDAFQQAEGHAEEGIIRSLAHNEHVVFGAASRNVCWGVCHRIMSEDMALGGPPFPGKADKSPYRMFWLDSLHGGPQ